MMTRSRALLAAAMLAAGACAPKAVRSRNVLLCRASGCETVSDGPSRARLLSAFHDLLRRSKGRRITFYSSDPGSRAEKSPGLRFYTQGGPIPGMSTISSVDVRDVLFIDREKGESRARVHPDAYYVGVPLLCTEGDLSFQIQDDEARFYFSDICTWLAVGTTGVRFEWMIDRLDADRGVASGHWAARTAGLPVLGGGSGYLVARFATEDERAAPAAPAPPPTPAPVAAAPVPKPAPPVPADVVESISETVDLGLSVKLADEDGDLILDGGEAFTLETRVENRGRAPVEKIRVRLSGEPALTACLGASKDVPALKPGASAAVVFSCRLPRAVPAETVSLRVELAAGDKGSPAGARVLRIGMRPAAQAVEQVVSETSVDDIPPSSKSPVSGNAALIVGLSKYRDKSIPGVKYAARDAEVVARYLERVAGVKPENLKLITDDTATKSDLTAYLEEWLPRHVTPESTVYVYFAGHGAHDDLGREAFLVPYEGSPEFPSKLYGLSRLYESLAKLPAKNAVVMLDSCFAGAGDRGVSKAGARPLVMKAAGGAPSDPRISVLAGADGVQLSSDFAAAEHGLFTYYLLKGMRGEADADRDGVVTLTELYSFVRERVADKASRELNRDQTPVLLGGSSAGVVAVARP